MGKVILFNVSVYSGLVDACVYGFLDCPVKVMPLPAYCAGVLHSGLGRQWQYGGYVFMMVLLGVPCIYLQMF